MLINREQPGWNGYLKIKSIPLNLMKTSITDGDISNSTALLGTKCRLKA